MSMAVKGWQKAAIVAGMGVGSIVGVGVTSMSMAGATVVQAHGSYGQASYGQASYAQASHAQAARPAQDLPVGYYIDGSTLYNYEKKPVKLPPGWMIKAGVILDPHGVEAKVVLKTSKATTTSPIPITKVKNPQCMGLHNKGGLDGMINTIVASALCLGDKVTKDSLHFAATATDAVVGPNGLLMLG
ncbi:hypothetical protein J4573_33140 [Actinomadura barringtoniae]|uniref:Uncharacterized protein n=1 Tax=Actinomadura barringtoniae TaxID=1427535 RepID=A0A939T6I2_9ACTN|nr:hypothetical protein [Actinomadura barringtoniae]MBO2451973.1 hypothetical protein [Actinomadura barringtoniae]